MDYHIVLPGNILSNLNWNNLSLCPYLLNPELKRSFQLKLILVSRKLSPNNKVKIQWRNPSKCAYLALDRMLYVLFGA